MKENNLYLKFLALLVLVVLMSGCVHIIHQYSPRKTPSWKNDTFTSHFKYQCNGGEVGVSPITTYPKDSNSFLLAVDIHSPTGQTPCNISAIYLENTKTEERLTPLKVDTLFYNDKRTTVCFYEFDILERPEIQYDLHISDQLLGCSVEPIPYVFEKTWEFQPQQLM